MAMSIEDFKRIALERAQAAPPNPSLQAADPQALNSAMAAPMQSPQVTPQSQPGVTNPQTDAKPGPIKGFLQSFLYGAGQGLLAHNGLETDAQKQQRMFNQNLQLQNAQALNDLRSQQAQASQSQNQPVDLSTFGIPGLAGTVAQKDAAKVISTHLAGQSREKAAATTGESRENVADTNANARATQQTLRGQQQAAHDALTSQVQRDIAGGRLQMAGARLSLARQIAAAKQNGTFQGTTADRLKRGDLANNAQDNIESTIEDIQKNPDLFGKIGGRYTSVQQMMGSDDPAISRIGIQIHNAALASNGAHGLRSAQAIEGTEKMMLNHFRNSPEATISGLRSLSDSLNTFVQDATQGKSFTPRKAGESNQTSGSSGNSIPTYERGADGKLHLVNK